MTRRLIIDLFVVILVIFSGGKAQSQSPSEENFRRFAVSADVEQLLFGFAEVGVNYFVSDQSSFVFQGKMIWSDRVYGSPFYDYYLFGYKENHGAPLVPNTESYSGFGIGAQYRWILRKHYPYEQYLIRTNYVDFFIGPWMEFDHYSKKADLKYWPKDGSGTPVTNPYFENHYNNFHIGGLVGITNGGNSHFYCSAYVGAGPVYTFVKRNEPIMNQLHSDVIGRAYSHDFDVIITGRIGITIGYRFNVSNNEEE